MSKAWTQKYAPKVSSDVVGQNKAVEQIKNFLKNYKSQRKKAAIVYGEPGNGKTSSVYAVAKELDLEILEINASDARNSAAIQSKLGAALGQQSLFFKSKLILLDEIDGVAGREDRGGVAALARIIDTTKYPIIMTANNPYDKKFASLRKKSEIFEFHTLAYPSIMKVLKKICEGEKLEYDETALTAVARRAGGDLRGAIIDLQTISMGNEKITMESLDLLGDREKTDTMINALMKIFKTVKPEVARPAFYYVPDDIDQQFLWLEYNIPYEYKKPKDLQRAYDALSLADVFRSRIRKRQHWRYLVYVNDLNTAGIALAKDEKYPGYTPYKPTTRILKIWQANMKFEKRKAIADKIAAHTHTSRKRVIQSLPYLKKIFENNSKQAKIIAETLELDQSEVMWLKKP